jgi:primosomal protein N' (replication factor Y)
MGMEPPDEANRTCLRIAVSLPVKGTFTYSAPKGLSAQVRIGHRVMVPFRSRKVTGYVLEKVGRTQDRHLKEILEIIDPDPLFPTSLAPLFEWMADYYMNPIGEVIRSALPGGLDLTPFKTACLTEIGLKILPDLPPRSEEKRLLLWLKDHPGRRAPWPLQMLYPLEKKGWITIQEKRKKGRTGPQMRLFVRPREGVDYKALLSEDVNPSRADHEAEFLETLFASRAIPLAELTARFSNGYYLVEKWTKKGVLERYEGVVYRDPAGKIMHPSPTPPKLYEQQRRVLVHIQRRLEKKGFFPFMLYGVTGSGKTEVYYQAVVEAFRSGRQAILVVPEIALAVYMESVFRSRLGHRVGIYHSGLSRGERYDQWMRMVRGQVDLVVGARSAVFAPLPRLGLIIVDEEHDSAYKQEGSLRYQARDTAVVRAKMEQALVILGSGTPSVQSFHNSMNGRYHLLLMPDRIEKRPQPEIEIVDMKSPKNGREESQIFSPRLMEAIGETLGEGNQTILFLNRRGFHRVYLCRSCGQPLHCPNCNVGLTHHRGQDKDYLLCHYCGFFSEIRQGCPSCGRGSLRPYGFGTEKLEQGLKEALPGARIARMDTDSVRRKGEIFRILKRFSDHQLDILVGTQMITKGYDFPKVTLVGVIAADLSLGFPDFRAGERTFQILSQVAGRSGRGDQKGRVIIQTFNPDHYAIQTAMAHDYRSFFEKEKELRAQLGYPPFSHLTCLRLRGNNSERTSEAARRLSLKLKGTLDKWPKRGKDVQVLGPVEAPITRLKGKYRWQILVKSPDAFLTKHLLRDVEWFSKRELQPSGVHLIVDVDPYQMI